MTANRIWAAGVAALLLGLAGCGDASRPGTSRDGVPEEHVVHPISHILLKNRPATPLGALAASIDVLDEIRGGRSFADVARDRSEDALTAPSGGFMGFFRPGNDEGLNAAVQAIPIGAVSGPIQLNDGVHLIYRHPFEEGRDLESRQVVIANGFFVPWSGSVRPANRSREAAREEASALVQSIGSGAKTLASAFEGVFGKAPARDDLLIGVFRDVEEEREIYEKLGSVPVGAFLPVSEFPGGFAVVQRGQFFRTLVRQILVQHIEAPERKLAIQRSRSAAKQLAEEIVAQLAPDGSNWSDLVKRYSDDPISVPLNGFIGGVSNGDLVPALEAALRTAPIGVPLRRVVETERGFHILYPVK